MLGNVLKWFFALKNGFNVWSLLFVWFFLSFLRFLSLFLTYAVFLADLSTVAWYLSESRDCCMSVVRCQLYMSALYVNCIYHSFVSIVCQLYAVTNEQTTNNTRLTAGLWAKMHGLGKNQGSKDPVTMPHLLSHTIQTNQQANDDNSSTADRI